MASPMQFTHEEIVVAASAVASQTATGRVLREETNRLIAEAWPQGELTYCVSNQFAIQLLLELTAARKALEILAHPLRPPFSGESREEFERDRMGQTGEDNARKMFGDKEKN